METNNFEGTHKRYWRAYPCPGCGGVVLAGSSDESKAVSEVYPPPMEVDPNIPEEPRRFLKDAIASIHAPSASIMAAASAVDAMLKEKGYEDDVLKGKGYRKPSLFDRITQAENDHVITPSMSMWAHRVRLDANKQRHTDKMVAPTTADAKHTVDFARALGEFLYVLPARVNRGIAETPSPTT